MFLINRDSFLGFVSYSGRGVSSARTARRGTLLEVKDSQPNSMEEQPRDRAHEHQHKRHGQKDARSRSTKHLNDVRRGCELQLQETQKEKTGNGKLNSFDLDDGKILPEDDSTIIPSPLEESEDRNLLNLCLKQGLPGDIRVTVSSKNYLHHTDIMDGNNKTSGLQLCDVKPLGVKEPVFSLNGDSAHSSGYIANGYSSKVDNDGSGSESGYTTPKKRRARRFSVKGSDSVVREEAGQRGILAYSKQDPEPSGQEVAGKVVNSRPNCTRICLKPEVHTGVRRTGALDITLVGEAQCKNSDTKASGPISKKTDDKTSKAKLTTSVTSKEDSWTLFKPPPVFPVDNSTAKIVPKISYASKVKENLNKATQASSEAVPAQASVKISQVPMSAVKMVSSAPFSNGPVLGEANGCPSEGTLFNSAVSSVLLASSDPGEENVESTLDPRSSACPPASEPRKPSLVYPLKPLNMLSSARHTDSPAAQTNQKALGEILHNQWGLSFINEPNVGPEGAAPSRPAAGLQAADITFQGGSLPFLGQPGWSPTSVVSLPEPREAEGWTSGTDSAPMGHCLSRTTVEEWPRAPPEEQKVESGVSEVSRMDLDTEHAETPLVHSPGGPSKEHTCLKGQARANSCGLFDQQAAVFYHTKEFEYLINLQKQDPKKVVCYGEIMDRPDH
ncbi:FMR1-interacting protein NUFIP2-like [Brachyhypopomus gauderio]|uniref:FMR1-interacting protein NUFIP2-like n=1 Tax=Brachyhypopomus gauderio TaxID=698409 RepID=UPI004041B798